MCVQIQINSSHMFTSPGYNIAVTVSDMGSCPADKRCRRLSS